MFFMKKKEMDLIEINGIFEGSVNFNGRVIISATGLCKMDIVCNELDIMGRLEGKVDVNILNIYDTGIFTGKAKYGKLNQIGNARVQFEGQEKNEKALDRAAGRPTEKAAEKLQALRPASGGDTGGAAAETESMRISFKNSF